MLFVGILLWFLHFSPTFAVEEFSISENVSYHLDKTGQAQVQHELNLTNNISQIYAKEYEITLNGITPTNITAHDQSGNILDRIDNSNNNTSIYLKFSNPTIGKGQTNRFAINYNLVHLASRKGNTWEITLPSKKNVYQSQQYTININIPISYGSLSFSSATVKSNHQVGDYYQLTLENPSSSKNIFLIFGDHQILDFKLNYFLENSESSTVDATIPLPPDTNTQLIKFKNISPPPQYVSIDADGNWLAHYWLVPNQSVDITAEGQAKIHPSDSSIKIKPEDFHLQSQPYWPVDDPQVKTLSPNLDSPKKIYDYVVNTLNYDYQRLDSSSRLGALAALENPNQSLCTEFTDLFVTLARSGGIPAREIEGFALSNNPQIKPTNTASDILHAWPEYFDQTSQTWRQVDPTWEKTTNGIDYFTDIDLNHLAFVIHGKNSQMPLPPGAYQSVNHTRSVYVDLAQDEINLPEVNLQLQFTDGKLVLFNPNLFAFYDLKIESSFPNITADIPILPPLGKYPLPDFSINYFYSIIPSHNQFIFKISSPHLISPQTISITNPWQKHHQLMFLGGAIFVLSLSGIIISKNNK